MSHVPLWIHVQPRASRTEVVGWHGDAVKIRLKAPPVDGAANDELIRFLAKKVGVPKSSIEIVAGSRNRRKRVKLHDVGKAELIAALGLH